MSPATIYAVVLACACIDLALVLACGSGSAPYIHRVLVIGYSLAKFLLDLLASYCIVVCSLSTDYVLPFCLASALLTAVCALVLRYLRRRDDREVDWVREQLAADERATRAAFARRTVAEKAAVAQARREVHDELVVADELLRREEIKAASDQIRTVSGIMHSVHVRYCDHRYVDALIAPKAEYCAAHGIAFTSRLEVPDNLDLPSVDVCGVFANMVDNAIHGCEAAEEGEGRFVDVRASVVNGYLIVTVSNRSPEGVSFEVAPGYSRASESLPLHGWGMAIIRQLAGSHDGTFNIVSHGTVCEAIAVLKVGS